MKSAQPPWGERSLYLSLPFAPVLLQGLSNVQHSTLQQEFSLFIAASESRQQSTFLRCVAYRLPHAPRIEIQELSKDGQYTPRQRACDDGIELTGVNFQALLPIHPGGRASLGVADESELARIGVIENFLRIYTAHHNLQQGGLVLHSAGIVINNQAFIFQGRSNAGKTTLSRKAHDSGAWILSDDINVLLPDEGPGYRAYAVPFSGEFGRTLTHQGGRESYPVAAIILLSQGELLRAEPVTAASAVAALYTGCPFVNTCRDKSAALFNVLSHLVDRVPILRLTSQRHDSYEDIMAVIQTALQSMTGGPHEKNSLQQ